MKCLFPMIAAVTFFATAASACMPSDSDTPFADIIRSRDIVLRVSILDTGTATIPHRYVAHEYGVALVEVRDLLAGSWPDTRFVIWPANRLNTAGEFVVFLKSDGLDRNTGVMTDGQPFAGVTRIELSSCGGDLFYVEAVEQDQRGPILLELFDGIGDPLERAIELDLDIRLQKEGRVAPSVVQSPRPKSRP